MSALLQSNAARAVRGFYAALVQEVSRGNPLLDREEQARLDRHHSLLKKPGSYHPDLVASVYLRRRMVPVEFILKIPEPLVFDAGCGCGSDSILFASVGARVLSVNLSAEEIGIAQKRVRYFEGAIGRKLDIHFVRGDLNELVLENEEFSLTWLASILAVIREQDSFLKQVARATRAGGKIIIVDYNLLHPPFLWREWRRRRRALKESPEFARQADFWAMVGRAGRTGARFFPMGKGGCFDDVQFFTPRTLANLLRRAGFRPLPPSFTGCAPPFLSKVSICLEQLLSRMPGWNYLGRAYSVIGQKE